MYWEFFIEEGIKWNLTMSGDAEFPVSVGEQVGKGEENVKGDIRKDKCQPKTFVTVECRVTSQI